MTENNFKPLFSENVEWSTKKKLVYHQHEKKEDSNSDNSFSSKDLDLSDKKVSVIKMLRRNSPPKSISFSTKKKENYATDLLLETEVIKSPFFCPNKEESYFEQAFEIYSKVGSGSFGDVYRVKSLADEKLYAIKRSRNVYLGSKHRNKMIDEVKTHFILSDKNYNVNILNYYSSWEENGLLYIQTELCLMNLRNYTDTRIDNLNELCIHSICYQISKGLEYIHGKDYVHLDIKPDNIFIGKDQQLKIGDFGIALNQKINNFELTHDDMDGEAKYIAPEVLTGSFSVLSDIFSFGLLILEILANVDLPIGEKLWNDLRSNIIPFHLFKYSSNFLKNLVKICLSKLPEQRPSASFINNSIVAETNNRHLVSNFQFIDPNYISNFINERDKRIKISVDHNETYPPKRILIKSKIDSISRNLFQDFDSSDDLL